LALKLVFLGRLEDVAGAPERLVPHCPNLVAVLSGLDEALRRMIVDSRVRIAVNGALAGDSAALVLEDGDEIAFLPPVSGG